MNEQKNECPCEAVRHLAEMLEKHDERLESHEKRLAEGSINFAVINTKLNLMLGVLCTIGVAIAGVLVKYILNFSK